jgi:FKBP-type peptidyl-prolyl cis-trans isomerase FkpA
MFQRAEPMMRVAMAAVVAMIVTMGSVSPSWAQGPAKPAAGVAKQPAGTAKPAATTAKPQPAGAKPATAPAAPRRAAAAPMTDEQKTVYALGLLLQRSLAQFDLSAAELEIIKRALSDAAAGKPVVDLDEFGPKVEPLAGARGQRMAAREKVVSSAYLVKAATEAGAVKTDSGLVYRDVTTGTGASPTAADTVKVHYHGTLTNGSVFDSSVQRNEPASFPLSGVIPCWTEAVQRMKVGGKARLVCPSDLAYGDQGRPTIPGGAALIFDVELLEIMAAPAAPPAN